MEFDCRRGGSDWCVGSKMKKCWLKKKKRKMDSRKFAFWERQERICLWELVRSRFYLKKPFEILISLISIQFNAIEFELTPFLDGQASSKIAQLNSIFNLSQLTAIEFEFQSIEVGQTQSLSIDFSQFNLIWSVVYWSCCRSTIS